MAYFCFKCGAELLISSANATTRGSAVSRSDTCSKCMSDIRSCKNCTHYDPKIYNECKEPQADRIVDKEKSNYCDYFELARDRKLGTKDNLQSEALSALDSLFKK